MTEEKLSVPMIHCDHCKSSLEGAVGALPGVTRVEVDVPTAKIDVVYDSPATRGEIVAAIEGQGYEVAEA